MNMIWGPDDLRSIAIHVRRPQFINVDIPLVLRSSADVIEHQTKLLRECLPIIEQATPDANTPVSCGPDTQLDCLDMDAAHMNDLYHRIRMAIEHSP